MKEDKVYKNNRIPTIWANGNRKCEAWKCY